MAKFKSPLGIVSGKLGAFVFTAQGSVRQFAMPTNSNTIRQQEQRLSNTALVNAWQALTPEVQSGWGAITDQWPYIDSVGDSKTRSGY